MLHLNNLSLTIEAGTPLERQIIDQLSLSALAGEFITIIGGNGAGKSTLLSLITGDTATTAGTIIINEQDVTKKSAPQRAALIACVRQAPHLATLANMSVEENLSFALLRGQQRHLLPHRRAARLALFREKLATLGMGLEDRLEQPTSALSGGQRQALSLVMATLTSAKILLLDEHTAALDPNTARRVMTITQEIVQRSGLTTLMITHNMADALAYGSRTLVLQGGRIVRELGEAEKRSLMPQDLVTMLGGII